MKKRDNNIVCVRNILIGRGGILFVREGWFYVYIWMIYLYENYYMKKKNIYCFNGVVDCVF